MKSLVVYSSRTGNTRKLAEAIAAVLPGARLCPVQEAPDPQEAAAHALVALGYWVRRGGPDPAASAYLAALRGATVALFGTLGAWPDSPHAAQCRERGEALLTSPERGNRVLGTFLCQGRVNPAVVRAADRASHPMTPERIARLAEAARHPDAADLARAREFFAVVARRVGEAGRVQACPLKTSRVGGVSPHGRTGGKSWEYAQGSGE